MVRVIGVILKDQRLLFNDGMALLADILSKAASFLTVVARATQMPEVNGERRIKFRGVKKESESTINILTYSATAA